jgi:hypothetical protein
MWDFQHPKFSPFFSGGTQAARASKTEFSPGEISGIANPLPCGISQTCQNLWHQTLRS